MTENMCGTGQSGGLQGQGQGGKRPSHSSLGKLPNLYDASVDYVAGEKGYLEGVLVKLNPAHFTARCDPDIMYDRVAFARSAFDGESVERVWANTLRANKVMSKL
ncbi:hypothetical protein PM082_022409 [Marasmius tenuissimus]|nr:hypothetical protein PM082_022409 [Marasmius tenuissimus]